MTERVAAIRRFLDQEYMPDGQFWYHQALRDLLTALAQAERECDEIRESLEPGTAPRIVAGMFAEAEKRGMSPFSAKHALAWLCEQLDAARAEVEECKRTHATLLLSEQAHREQLQAEVERLQRRCDDFQHDFLMEASEHTDTKADLARVRAALEWKRDADAAGDDAIWERGYNAAIDHMRAALEGRG